MAHEEVTPAYLTLSTGPAQITNNDVAVLEWFTILLYDHTSSTVKIDEARQKIVMKKGQAIPLTRAAWCSTSRGLCSVYQGGHCCGNAFKVVVDMPCHGNWGCFDPHNWKPIWNTLSEASTSLSELLCFAARKVVEDDVTARKQH